MKFIKLTQCDEAKTTIKTVYVNRDQVEAVYKLNGITTLYMSCNIVWQVEESISEVLEKLNE